MSLIKLKVDNAQQVEAAIKKALSQYAFAPAVTVGIHEDTGMHSDSQLSNATLGALLNYGNQKIPPRPWLIPGYLKNEKKYAKDFVNSISDDKNVPTAMLRIGALATDSIKTFMNDLKTPPNAPLTIKRKGFDNPLIDTGELRESVDYKLDTSLPTEGGLS